MIQYLSNKGGGKPVDFETAILNGFGDDGGLYVPTELPQISLNQLIAWKNHSYTNLAFEVLSLFIDRTVVPANDLKQILADSFESFHDDRLIPLYELKSFPNLFLQELFYGPTLSFKDVAMGFLVNLFNYFLKRKKEKMTLVVATTGDTGPAAAQACIRKDHLDIWVLYPKELITEEQERQMTTIFAPNVHPVGVRNCPDGADDLDLLIAKMFGDMELKKTLNLSSVNSINWGRVMMQTVHYFYGYLQLVEEVGQPMNFSVPSGAFGNLCAGSLARLMGLPVGKFIVANNLNGCLNRIFTKGIFLKKDIIACESSAIDILIPYNFWRYLYFAIGQQPVKIKAWIQEFEEKGKVVFDRKSFKAYSKDYLTDSISDEQTLAIIEEIYQKEAYLLDPHGAVAVAGAMNLKSRLDPSLKTLCLATAHPCKFPQSIQRALSLNKNNLPKSATHFTIEAAKQLCQNGYSCDYVDMETTIINSMIKVAKFRL